MSATLLTIIYGVFSLGILIMVHELGHFIAGKLSGIRVTAFSIGFGRGIFSFDFRGTHYKVGWLPFGGYCRFAGEGEDLKDDRKGEPDEFYERPAWARLVTVSAGVIFNFLFGIFIYWVLALSGSSYSNTLPRVTVLDRELLRFRAPKLASMRQEFPALAAGLRDGDIITHVNDRALFSYRDLTQEILTRGRETIVLTLLRDGKKMKKKVVTGLSRRGAGYINVSAWAPPVLSSVAKGSPAEKSGLKSGDLILSVDGKKVRNTHLDLIRLLRIRTRMTNRNRLIRLQYSRYATLAGSYTVDPSLLRKALAADGYQAGRHIGCRLAMKQDRGGFSDGMTVTAAGGDSVHSFSGLMALLADRNPGKVISLVLSGGQHIRVPVGVLRSARPWQAPQLAGIAPGSALYRKGLRNGDIIAGINGKKAGSSLRTAVSLSGKGAVRLTLRRRLHNTALVSLKKGKRRIGIRISPALYEFQTEAAGIIAAVGIAFEDFGLSFSRIVKGLSVLFQPGVSIRESTGGPISLIGLSGRVLKDSNFRSWLELLALLSIAIGFMNLLPIPALDGGHIILTLVELIRGKRMSFKVLHRIQFVGVVILFALFFFILSLDIFKLKSIF